MRKWIVIGVFAACGIGIGGTAFANYFYPARVIIGTGIIGGKTTGSTLGQDAQKMGGGEGCTIAPPIECACSHFGMPLWEACFGPESGQHPPPCLTPDTQYDVIKQDPGVLMMDGSHRLGGLRCGKNDGEALVNLP